MKLAQAEVSRPSLVSSKCGPLAELYQNVLLQVKYTKRHRNFGNLWSRVAPGGNIYRYNGLAQERMRHCFDLDKQLQEVAEEHKVLLGESVSPQERCHLLVKALKETNPSGLDTGSEDQIVSEGFMPLEEFLDADVTSTAGVCHPSDPDERGRWFFNNLLAMVVFTIQTVGAGLVLMQGWYADTNHIRDPMIMWKHLTWKETACMGTDRSAIMCTFMGTLFVVLINIMIYNHSRDETDNAAKMGRLPADNGWLILGNIADISCCILIIVAIPLELWGENGIQGIIMNSMAMLFVFTLGDLTGGVFGYLGEDDAEFQKEASWNYALLAFCPLNIRDLIDSQATTVEQLWKISYNTSGCLMAATGEVCETRVMQVQQPPTEDSALVSKNSLDDDTIEKLVVKYHVRPDGRTRHLPGLRSQILQCLWMVTNFYIAVMSFVTPVIWFILNKPCDV